MVKLPVNEGTKRQVKSPLQQRNEEDTGTMEVSDESAVADNGGRDAGESGKSEFQVPAVPVKLSEPETTKASLDVVGDEAGAVDDQSWEKAKKRGRTSRKPDAPATDGSDSSDPESKLRLLDKQVERTRSRSQRRSK